LANPSRKTETNTEPASRDLSVSHVVQHGVAINIATFSETTSQDFELALDSTSSRWQLIPGSASIALNEQPLTEPRFIKPGDAVLTGNQAFQFIQVR
jgi:hypothetical protein